MAGKAVSEIELSDAVFGITPNPVAVHACVVNYLANQRQGLRPPPLTSVRVSVDCVPW
ncbi:50S ribosomal protein L4, partial [Anaerotruncus colihominis]|uniref:50S ribosomal protein L4 n=1 Tax=Anaerotruncus colihominis TaxID=169435 RepID=UPI00210D086E